MADRQIPKARKLTRRERELQARFDEMAPFEGDPFEGLPGDKDPCPDFPMAHNSRPCILCGRYI